mmetsp:Transcript_17233/g.41499  ORF Transcript_17233/g.41499 Transcript_17233/m.41499 type:complete len:173 (+) Transcript_17233:343-861(+)
MDSFNKGHITTQSLNGNFHTRSNDLKKEIRDGMELEMELNNEIERLQKTRQSKMDNPGALKVSEPGQPPALDFQAVRHPKPLGKARLPRFGTLQAEAEVFRMQAGQRLRIAPLAILPGSGTREGRYNLRFMALLPGSSDPLRQAEEAAPAAAAAGNAPSAAPPSGEVPEGTV